jgi:glycosyltransferase involved in cell wall biosynthesis
MDSHTSAFDRVRWVRLMPLHAFLARRAIWAATTNDELTERVNAMGATGISVTDIPFEFPDASYAVEDGFTVAVVCSFDDDEPVQEIFDAARSLDDVTFYVTGNPKKAPEALRDSCPRNVTLTGYLSNENYVGLLRSVSAIMVLTTNDFTMQRGGSEAISVERPLITSDFQMLRDVFHKGTVHVDNSPEQIADAVKQLQADLPRYEREMREMKRERDEWWTAMRADLQARIDAAMN